MSIEDGRHALFVGAVMGIAHRRSVWLRPVADADGNWTDQLEVVLPGLPPGFLRLTVPPPPADFDFNAWFAPDAP